MSTNPAPLTLTSIQAPNQDDFIQDLAEFLAARLARPVRFVRALPWQVRAARLDRGEIDLGWICGLPYVRKADLPQPPVTLLAAPVPAGARYGDQPVYFSDVIVRAGSPYQSFPDLRGASWAYNEPNSQSGYNITRYTLAKMGAYENFFGQVVAAGSHQAAIEFVLRGEVAASAIDSTVLEIELRQRPQLDEALRVIAVLGPSPIPPLVARRLLPAAEQEAVRQALLSMHTESAGRAVLARHFLRRFAAVTDTDYDPIREMARLAEQVRW
ncbi:MAG: phosphate/phosphite/phosphonate ABC transporter substrate-binding protein [Anaerolineales bacterium]